jgi:hypothetical protein
MKKQKNNVFTTTAHRAVEFLKEHMGGIFFVALFLVMVMGFSIYFLRKDTVVYAKLYLTEREESKHWMNYPDSYYYDDLEVGLTEKNELGKEVASIADVYRMNTSYQHEQALATVKILANYNKATGVYSFQGQPLIVGDYQRFKIGSLRLQGYLLSLSTEQKAPKEKEYTIVAELDDVVDSDRGNADTRVVGVQKAIADAVKKGDKIIDSHGNVAAEVMSVNFQPAVRTLFSVQGQTKVVDPAFVSGEVVLKLRTLELDGVDYWDFVNPMQVGQRLSVNLPGVLLPVRILRVDQVSDVKN